MIDGGILHQVHLLMVIENKRVVILTHEEMFLSSNVASRCASLIYHYVIYCQREMDAFHLKFANWLQN